MATYHYRDKLTRKELLPALGAGVGAGLGVGVVVGYITQLLLRKRSFSSSPTEGAALPTEPGKR